MGETGGAGGMWEAIEEEEQKCRQRPSGKCKFFLPGTIQNP